MVLSCIWFEGAIRKFGVRTCWGIAESGCIGVCFGDIAYAKEIPQPSFGC